MEEAASEIPQLLACFLLAKMCSGEGWEGVTGNSSWAEWTAASCIPLIVPLGPTPRRFPPNTYSLIFQLSLREGSKAQNASGRLPFSGWVPSCPFPSNLPHLFLTIILSTFSFPRVTVYPGPPHFAPGVRYPVLFFGGCSLPGSFSLALPVCPSPCLLDASASHPTMGGVSFPFLRDASGIPWVVYGRYKGRGLTPMNRRNHQGLEQSFRPPQARPAGWLLVWG